MNPGAVTDVPSYGILKKNSANSAIDRAVEEISSLGFSTISSGLSAAEIDSISMKFDLLHRQYLQRYGPSYLESLDEHNTIRLPLAFDRCFLQLAANEIVMNLLERLIIGKFILNQQNGIINPAGQRYNQGAWHRDLPYQHFVSSRPIAINALFCVDGFTSENGATHVLPASHKQESFPSDAYVLKNSCQITAPAGSFIIVDCMTFHRGGANNAKKNRRAINHVYTIPHIRQQIDIPAVLNRLNVDVDCKDLLGYKYELPQSIDGFLDSRKK